MMLTDGEVYLMFTHLTNCVNYGKRYYNVISVKSVETMELIIGWGINQKLIWKNFWYKKRELSLNTVIFELKEICTLWLVPRQK